MDEKAYSGVLRDLREELDEHLDAINRNTEEVTETHEDIAELEVRLEKLAERIDALQALLLSQTPSVKSVRLTPKEEEMLKILLEAKEPLTSLLLGKMAGLTADAAAQTLYCLKQKGVPLLATTVDEQTFYALEAQFRDLQRARVTYTFNQ
ncbi:TPA: hypothetical protein HA251_04915 [Candidatus Woesearchaeota archaeon]|nr:hypothetical protein [Candidatus Woesearchaeota archaeon]